MLPKNLIALHALDHHDYLLLQAVIENRRQKISLQLRHIIPARVWLNVRHQVLSRHRLCAGEDQNHAARIGDLQETRQKNNKTLCELFRLQDQI